MISNETAYVSTLVFVLTSSFYLAININSDQYYVPVTEDIKLFEKLCGAHDTYPHSYDTAILTCNNGLKIDYATAKSKRTMDEQI
jgi:hypothetical protein